MHTHEGEREIERGRERDRDRDRHKHRHRKGVRKILYMTDIFFVNSPIFKGFGSY